MKIIWSVLGGLALLSGLVISASSHAWLARPAQLALLHPKARIIIASDRELDPKTSTLIIDEINAARVLSCTEFDGKSNQPELVFSVKQPEAPAPIQFALRHDEITQLKGTLTSGGYACRLDLGKSPNLKALLESASR